MIVHMPYVPCVTWRRVGMHLCIDSRKVIRTCRYMYMYAMYMYMYVRVALWKIAHRVHVHN